MLEWLSDFEVGFQLLDSFEQISDPLRSPSPSSATLSGLLTDPDLGITNCPDSFYMIIHAATWHTVNANPECILGSNFCGK